MSPNAPKPDPGRLVLLGTGTCQLDGRKATAALLEIGDLRLVYDFGRGVAARLAALGLRQDDVEHVVLSHFHPDHLSDLIPYLQAASWSRVDERHRDLHVHGPRGLEVQMMRLLALFETDNLVRREHFRVILHEERGDRLELRGREGRVHAFEYADLPPAGNRGLKWSHGGKSYALTGDSSFHDQEIEFLCGVDLAVIDSGHLEDDEIVELAVQSDARRIICSHLYREIDGLELTAQARRRGFHGRIEAAEEGMVFRLPS